MSPKEISATNDLPDGIPVTGNELNPDTANPAQIIEAAAKRAAKGYSPSKSTAPVVEHSPSFADDDPRKIGDMPRGGIEVKHGPAPGDVVAW